MGGTIVRAAITLMTSIMSAGSLGSRDLASKTSPSSSSKISLRPYYTESIQLRQNEKQVTQQRQSCDNFQR